MQSACDLLWTSDLQDDVPKPWAGDGAREPGCCIAAACEGQCTFAFPSRPQPGYMCHWCAGAEGSPGFFPACFQISFAGSEQGGRAELAPGMLLARRSLSLELAVRQPWGVVSTSALLLFWGQEKQIVKQRCQLQLLAVNWLAEGRRPWWRMVG